MTEAMALLAQEHRDEYRREAKTLVRDLLEALNMDDEMHDKLVQSAITQSGGLVDVMALVVAEARYAPPCREADLLCPPRIEVYRKEIAA